jgi:hypothetical protein
MYLFTMKYIKFGSQGEFEERAQGVIHEVS